MSLAEFVCTILLKPRPLRIAANWMLRQLIPNQIEVGGAKVAHNQRDPVVCGALALGMYEKDEIEFLTRAVKPGMTILDIGGNVGLYNAILGKGTGPSGHVFTFEPDPENFNFLSRTVEANAFRHVTITQASAAAIAGTMRLFPSSENRSDNLLYGNELADGSVDVAVINLDDFLAERGVHNVDLIKIDVQGFEGHVLAGLETTLRNSKPLTLLAEFWPEGLRRAGSDPIALLDNLKSCGLTLHTLEPGATVLPVTDLEALVARPPGRKYTNIVGLKQQCRSPFSSKFPRQNLHLPQPPPA